MKIRVATCYRVLALLLVGLCGGLTALSSQTAQAQDQSPSQNSTPAPATSAAQEPPPAVTIRQNVRRVVVDVMVRDANGKPVHGLSANDFSIKEDKEPQRIASFDVYDFEKESISRGPKAAPLPPNLFVNVPVSPERGPLYVMLCDLVNTEMDDQMMARQQILKFIRSKPEGTRFAIFVTTDKLRLIQGFTADKNLLYAAMDPYHPKPHVPKVFLLGANYGRGDPYTALDMLTHIGQYLDGIPGRKNLIWVAGRFEVALFPREGDPSDLQANIRAEINALAQAQVAVFPVDVRGVVVNPEGALTGAQPAGGPNAVLQAMEAGHSSISLYQTYASEETVAAMTGGRAFYSTNDIVDALDQATEDGANYYTLTYSPPEREDNSKCHSILVNVAKEKYQLSYRRYYCRVPLVSTAEDESEETSGPASLVIPLQAGDVLQANMRPGAPMTHDLVFSAHVHTEGPARMATPGQMAELEAQAAAFRKRRKNAPAKPVRPVNIQTYVVDYRVLDPRPQGRRGKQVSLEFAVAAFDDDGRVENGVVNDGAPDPSAQPAESTSGENKSTENKSGLYRVRQTLLVPVGAVSIRVGVRDRDTDRMGTLEVPLPLAPEPVAKAR